MKDGELVIACYFLFCCFLGAWGIALLLQHIAFKIRYRPGVVFGGKIKYLSGLNIPEQTIMMAVGKKNELILSGVGQEFHISIEKIVSIERLTHSEVHHQIVANTAGAIAGAMVGGALGAIVLGSPSLKKYTVKGKLVVLAHQTENGIQYMLFDGSRYQNTIQSMLRFFKKCKTRRSVRIDL